MILGTQWYILFNVIVGASAISPELRYVRPNLGSGLAVVAQGRVAGGVSVLRDRGDYCIGRLVECGASWPKSPPGATTLIERTGWALTSPRTATGRLPSIVLGIGTMSLFVVVINRLSGGRLYYYAERKYRAYLGVLQWLTFRCCNHRCSQGISQAGRRGAVGLAGNESRTARRADRRPLGPSGSGKSTLLRLIAGLSNRAPATCNTAASRFRVRPPASPWCSRVLPCFPGSRFSRTWSSVSRRSACRDAEIRKRSLAAIDLSASTVSSPPIPRIVRRHASAGGVCPRPRGTSQHPVHGRAVFSVGRADGRDAAHRLPRSVGRRPHADQGCHPGDPQHRRGRADVRPMLVFGSNPGRILSEIKVDAAPAPQPPGSEFSRIGGTHLCGNDRAPGERGTRAQGEFPRVGHRQRPAARLFQLTRRVDGGGGRRALQRQGGSAGDRFGPDHGDR